MNSLTYRSTDIQALLCRLPDSSIRSSYVNGVSPATAGVEIALTIEEVVLDLGRAAWITA